MKVVCMLRSYNNRKRECGTVSLKNYSREDLAGMAMVEIANIILEDANKAIDFREIYSKLAEFKGYTEEQKHDFFAQFYTDLNIDGRFMTLGSDKWGLKRWYPVEQIDEQVVANPKKKKKSKKKQTKKDEEPEEPEEPEVINEDVTKATDDPNVGFDDYGEEALGEDEELDDEEFVNEDAENDKDDKDEEEETTK